MSKNPFAINCRSFTGALCALALALAWPASGVDAQQAPASCLVTGKVVSGTTPLPGVSVTARAGERLVAATSTTVDGTYKISLPPSAEYQLVVEMTAFARGQQVVAVGAPPCEGKTDFALVLASRVPNAVAAPVQTPASPAAGASPAGRGAAAGAAGQRFSTLDVQTDQTAAAALQVNPPDRQTEQATMALLPPGFSTDIPTEAVTINGQMASIDRGMMGDRLGAINRGEFDPATGEFAPGQEPAQGRGGRGGAAGPGGRGGRGAGDFAIGGRGGRGQSLFQASANYSYSGSALDSAPYQLRSDTPAVTNPYNRQNFGMTIGGPVIIPGVYNGTRRTTFTLTYGGNRGNNLFDQYATVPTAAQRSGDFSALRGPIVNPATGQAYAGNQIPQDQISGASQSLLQFIPLPNLDGTSRNFHYVTTRDTSADNVTVRLTHNFTQQAGRGGGRGGGGGGGRGGGGRGGQGLSVNMTAQVQYRRNENEQANVFPTLGGATKGTTLTLPVTLNISKNRVQHAIAFNYSRTTSSTGNHFAFVEDVAGNAGITGVSTDPLTWGVPSLSFSTFSNVRDTTASSRRDTRWSLSYTMTKPFRAHTLRVGGDVRQDLSRTHSDANASGAFTFTGLYSSGSSQVRTGGYDFADFLLGLPQQASVNYGLGEVSMRGRSFSLYVQDDWRKGANLTFNLGLRYELILPFTETNGRMVNLDAAGGFSAVSPVRSGASGPYSGAFPAGLIRTDTNNIAPRVGFAWRVAPGTVVRGGYGISYNSGSYSSMARQMVNQPPFAITNTATGGADAPLSLTDPLATASPDQITNDYGVALDYVLGKVQTYNADISKDLTQVWSVGASYTHIRGSDLDIVRAPNRGADGLLLADVQPFLWQSSEGSSRLHAAEFRLTRRPVRGLGGGVTYTLARSRDNASSMGGGTVVAQNDQDLAAEWGLSSFDRRHQLSANLNVDLPFGTGRRFFTNGGIGGKILGGWRFTTTYTWQSGTPLTVRVTGAASSVAQGTNGTLRANYDGSSIYLSNPTIDQFFNTAAFSSPAAGTYGNSSRNLVVGPGSRLLNAQFSRDLRLGGNRVMSLTLNANNLLNTVNYRGVNTTVNSPSFGQITSVGPMRSMTFNVRFRF